MCNLNVGQYYREVTKERWSGTAPLLHLMWFYKPQIPFNTVFSHSTTPQLCSSDFPVMEAPSVLMIAIAYLHIISSLLFAQ